MVRFPKNVIKLFNSFIIVFILISLSNNKLTATVPKNADAVDDRVKVKKQTSKSAIFPYKDSGDNGSILSNCFWIPLGVEEVFDFTGFSHFRLKNGDIFTVTSGYNATVSSDNGKTWRSTRMVDTTKYSMASSECLQTKDGVIIVAFMNTKERSWTWDNNIFDAPEATLPTYIVRSLDGGKTWLEPQKLHGDWTGAIRAIIETESRSVIITSMMLLHNPGRHAVLTYKSDDNGETWQRSDILDNKNSRGNHAGLMESTIVQLKDGRIWQLIRTNWDYFYESFSSDEGLTWSVPMKTDIDASSSPGALTRLKSGRLVLVWNRMYPEGETTTTLYDNSAEVKASYMRHQLSIMFSDDDGKTWLTPTVLAKAYNYTPPNDGSWDTSRWLSYPHIFEIEPGILIISTENGGLRIKLNEEDFLR